MSKKTLIASSASLALASLVGAAALPAVAGDQFLSADGFYGDVRLRYEDVEQNNALQDADATTVRTKLGFKTGVAHGIQALIEVEDVSRMGGNDYNSSINGKGGTHSTIADPVGTEVNQFWVSYNGISDTLIRVGRQGINLNNQRFVGTVGWRQNDQTFDSVLITNSSVENLDLAFAEIKQVNRIFGDNHPAGELDGTTRAANATYKVSDALSVTAHGLWIDLDDIPGLSTRTYGLRVVGSTALNDDWKLAYEAEYATQSDYANNTANYDVSYFHVAPALKRGTLTLKVGFESLEGNGTNSFATPLATLHKFNGWADTFLTTPANGIEDTYASASYVIKGQGNLLDNTKLMVVYHNFDAENMGFNYGDELDLLVAHPIPTGNLPVVKGASIALKYADYNKGDTHAGNTTVDTKKLWLTTQFKF